MSLSGTYSESLNCGATLRVTANKWWIEFYFPGPDLRYNGEWLKIEGRIVPQYIDAFMQNFEEYLTLKRTMPKDGSFEKIGHQGMVIRTSGYWEGVSITSHHMPLKTKDAIISVQRDFQKALSQAPQIMAILANTG